MSLGQIIRDKRESLHLTLDEVAAVTGFSKPYLSTIETGKVKNPPSDKLLCRLEEHLKFEPGHLQHIAHVERMPADVRQDYEGIDAENRRYKQMLKDVIRHRLDPKKLGEILNGCDVDEMADLS
ncbi:MAG: helix-turn-helix domain-containing protein, partial [Planctomycetota bacterium]